MKVDTPDERSATNRVAGASPGRQQRDPPSLAARLSAWLLTGLACTGCGSSGGMAADAETSSDTSSTDSMSGDGEASGDEGESGETGDTGVTCPMPTLAWQRTADVDDMYAVDAKATSTGELLVLAAEEDGAGYLAHLLRFDAEGAIVFDSVLAETFPRGLAPSTDDGAYVLAGDERVRAVDAAGSVAWEIDSPIPSSTAVIASADDGSFWLGGGEVDAIRLTRLSSAGETLVPLTAVEGKYIRGLGVAEDHSVVFASYETEMDDIQERDQGILGTLSADGQALAVTHPPELDRHSPRKITDSHMGSFAVFASSPQGQRYLVFDEGEVVFEESFADFNSDAGLDLGEDGTRFMTRGEQCPTCEHDEHQIATRFSNPQTGCSWKEVWGSDQTPRDSAAAIVSLDDGSFYSVGSLNTVPAGANNQWNTVVRRYVP